MELQKMECEVCKSRDCPITVTNKSGRFEFCSVSCMNIFFAKVRIIKYFNERIGFMGLTSFQKECATIGPGKLSEITGISYDTVKKWTAGYNEPDNYKQDAVLKQIKEWKNDTSGKTKKQADVD